MTLIKSEEQTFISEQRRMPVDNVGSDTINTISGETVQFYYYNTSGALTVDAGQAAGTVVVAKLANRNIKNSLGDVTGGNNDTSFAFDTGTILTTRVNFKYMLAEKYDLDTGSNKANGITAGFANGEFCIDHRAGAIYGKKATTGTSDTAGYKIESSVSGGGGGIASDININKIGGTATPTDDSAMPATPKVVPSGAEYRKTQDAYTDGDATVLHTDIDGNLRTKNNVIAGGNNIYSNMQDDFTATINNGAKTVTIAGLAFTLEAKHVIAGRCQVVDSSNDVSEVPLTDVAVSSGVITFADKAANFATGDVVMLTLVGPDKTYDSDLDVDEVINQAPEWSHYISETLVDDTNISAATVYYPSSTGASMDGYKDFSLSGKLIDADGTITMTVEMMNDEDTTSGDWIQIYGYDDKNNVTTNSWAVTNGTLTFANSFNNANYTNYRVKVIYSGSTNTAIIKQRKKS